MKYSAVVLDLDGTLLNSEKSISDRNHKSISACLERGMHIIFATARPPRAVKRFLPKELLDVGSFVFYNGALITSTSMDIHIHEPIPSILSAEILDHCLYDNPNIEIGNLKRIDVAKILITGDINKYNSY